MTEDVEAAARVLREKGFAAEAKALEEAVNGVYTTSGEAIAMVGAAVEGVRRALGGRLPSEAAAHLARADRELRPNRASVKLRFRINPVALFVGLAAGLLGAQLYLLLKARK